MPTPLSVASVYIVPASRDPFEAAYARAPGRELEKILAAIPAAKLAIQWEAAVEFALLEGLFPSHLGDGMLDATAGRLVAVANGVSARAQRSIDWIHMPVPKERDDDGYFARLAGLTVQPGCELYLGLVHMTGGIAGTRRRIAAAEKVVRNFGIATECGFGRRPADTIPDLFRQHVDAAGV